MKPSGELVSSPLKLTDVALTVKQSAQRSLERRYRGLRTFRSGVPMAAIVVIRAIVRLIVVPTGQTFRAGITTRATPYTSAVGGGIGSRVNGITQSTRSVGLPSAVTKRTYACTRSRLSACEG